uniref:VWFA domain-containing protein n=1 Tax=Amphilophus citrinellus TaxID=61819 RepID=A0A3Q0T7H2_AMPCI
VGIVTYNDVPTAQANLNTFKDKDEILQFINLLPYRKGGTNTGAALRFTLENIFTDKKGSRKDVPKIALVITDGKSQDNVGDAAIALRRAGVTVYAVGIKEANEAELVEMASYPKSKYVFTVDSFIKLKPLTETLLTTLSDIFFLMDDSGSIESNDFSDMQKFIIEFLRTFRIGPQHVRMGLVKYSDSPSLQFDLTEHSDAKKMEKAVERIHHQGGGTQTGRALSSMIEHFKNAKNSRGYKVSEYLIVITDGKSQDEVRIPAEELRALGVITYAIGVKDSNDIQLNEIAGNPNRKFFVSDFDTLKSIKNRIMREICSEEGNSQPNGGETQVFKPLWA